MATEKQRPHSSGRVVSVRLDDELIERLDALSARTHRSRGFYLRLALRAALPTLEREHWEQRAVEFEDRVLDRLFHQLMTQLDEETPPKDDGAGADSAPDVPLR